MSEIVIELDGRRISLHLREAARRLGLDLFGATLVLVSILVDLGELELEVVDHAVPTLDYGVVCTLKPIDRVLVEWEPILPNASEGYRSGAKNVKSVTRRLKKNIGELVIHPSTFSAPS